MKIAFTGTHVTGKTTLLKDYEKYFEQKSERKYSFGYISGIARSIIQRGFPLNKDGNIYSYVNYINDQLEAEKPINSYDIFISDRTLLSPLAYATANQCLPRPFIPHYFIKMMENIWLMEKERYDLYVYFPIEFPMGSPDNIHPSDEEYRQLIDATIVKLLNKFEVKYVTITGNRNERLKMLINILGI